MIEIIKDLYLAGYRFYIKNDILYLDSKNVIESKNYILQKLKDDPAKKQIIKEEVKQFKQLNLKLNDHTLKDVTTLMSNTSIEVINCDYNIIKRTIILVFKIKNTLDDKDREYISLLEEV